MTGAQRLRTLVVLAFVAIHAAAGGVASMAGSVGGADSLITREQVPPSRPSPRVPPRLPPPFEGARRIWER